MTRTGRSIFDASFYRRFYKSPATAVATQESIDRLARFVVHYLEYLRVPVTTVLDLGCGLGMWHRSLRNLLPRVEYTGVEASEYLCLEYGWTRGSAVDFKSRRKYDLVICQSVLQYLGDRDAGMAVRNISRLCRGAAYLEVPTKEDRASGTYDRRRTDGQVILRPASWYRRRLERSFVNCGGGLFLSRTSGVVLYELEKAP